MTVFINIIDTECAASDQIFIKKAINKTLKFGNVPDVDITVQLTTDEMMRQFNKKYRGIDKTTDVLSFNQEFIDPETHRLYLGDIVISIEQAQVQAPENHHTVKEECALLAIHGTLHLLGFDHSTAQEKEEMWNIQEKILKDIILSKKELAE
jgi:probable rRNA maturation factor